MKYIYLILILSFTSCVTKKQRARICNECKTTTTEYVRDSIYLKDTVVTIESDTAVLDALLECDSLGNVRVVEITSLQGDILKLETQIKNNMIKTVAKTDTVKVFVKGNTEIRYREKIVEVEVDRVSYKDYWWKWPILIWALFTTVVFLIKFRTTIFSFIKNLI